MEQIQAKSLEMAEYFVEFCNEHNLLCAWRKMEKR